MTRRIRLLNFLKPDLRSSLAYATVSLVLVIGIETVLALRHPFLSRLCELIAVFCVFYFRAWCMRRYLARVDEYQARTYVREKRIDDASKSLESVLNYCTHNYDTEHEQCRAYAKKQLKIIRHVLGHGPDPVPIPGYLYAMAGD